MASNVLPSVCPLDCPDTCSLTVTVKDDAVVGVRGSEANPITGGAVCAKVARDYPEFVHGAGRLRYPLRRRGPRGSDDFERIDWDDALNLIHRRVSAEIDQHGGETVLPLTYSGPHGLLAGDAMSARFFRRLGASRLDRAAMCGGIRSLAYAATFGAVPGTPVQELASSELIVVWGNNATVSNLHMVRYAHESRRRGGRLVVVDPRRTRIADAADLHVALRPGTDVALALAIIAEIERHGGLDRAFIDEHVLGFDAFMAAARRFPIDRAAALTGVDAEVIQTLAKWYADANPAAIAYGNGLERNRNGGSAVRAVCALPALAGKFGVRGGGIVGGAGHAFPVNEESLYRPGLGAADTRIFNILDVGAVLLDDSLAPPVRVVFIYNHNPLIVHPDQNRMRRALEQEDLFIVGSDVTLTDSMRYADVILPACTHFEHDDLFAAYGQQYLQRAAPVISPVGESLPNTAIFRSLAATFGFDEPELRATDEELMRDAVDVSDPRMAGFDPAALATDAALPMRFGGAEPLMFVNVFPRTPSGKIELESAALAERFGQSVPAYRELDSPLPLTLISPASNDRITSTFGGLDASRQAPPLLMHPDDAAAGGLTGGDRVRVWNELGEVFLVLEVTDAVRPGVVSSDKGAWLKTSTNGQTISALAPTHKADIAGGACYNDTRVEVAHAG